MICLICGKEIIGDKKFTVHLQMTHKIKSEEYSWKYIFSLNNRPKCLVDGCNELPRYSTFTFKKYCKAHAKIAMIEAGKYGGKIKKTWNKGQTKETNEIIKLQSIKCSGENNAFFGKKHSQECIDKLSAKIRLTNDEVTQRIEKRKDEWLMISAIDNYTNKREFNITWQCVKCNRQESFSLFNFERGHRCNFCYSTGSIPEDEIAKFVEDLGFTVVRNSRKIISPKELDIYIDDKKVAIEYHGLYWHSANDANGKDAKYLKKIHKEKFTLCKNNGVKLLQFFSDEWIDKKVICKSMIMNKLGVIKSKFMARKLELVQLTKDESKRFFTLSHIDGNARSFLSFGLKTKEGEIVQAISVRKPIQKKYKDTIEIARMASLPNTIVVGGASKLLKKVLKISKQLNFKQVLTYSDNRIGDGSIYKNSGFNFIGETGINYWYTDGRIRYDRFKYRAQPGKTEAQVASEHKVMKTFGAAHSIWIKDI